MIFLKQLYHTMGSICVLVLLATLLVACKGKILPVTSYHTLRHYKRPGEQYACPGGVVAGKEVFYFVAVSKMRRLSDRTNATATLHIGDNGTRFFFPVCSIQISLQLQCSFKNIPDTCYCMLMIANRPPHIVDYFLTWGLTANEKFNNQLFVMTWKIRNIPVFRTNIMTPPYIYTNPSCWRSTSKGISLKSLSICELWDTSLVYGIAALAFRSALW